MAFIHGKSKVFEKNSKTAEDEDKKQSLAIAYNMKKKAQAKKKMAEGGMLTDDGYQSESSAPSHNIHIHVNPQANVSEPGSYAKGGFIGSEQDKSHEEEMLHPSMDRHMPEHELEGSLYAKGGPVNWGEGEVRTSKGFWESEHGKKSLAAANKESENIRKAPNHQTESHDEDMVSRIMNKRMCKGGMYSEGGEIANEQGERADEDPNEFDDLAMDDDLEFKDTDKNSGDELGSKLNQDDDHEDMVGRIMKKRMKRG